jgi:hypothetical protein
MMRATAPLLTLLIALHLMSPIGCSRAPATTQGDAIERTIADPASGVELTMRVEQDAIGIADRVWVTTHWTWGDGQRVVLSTPDWLVSDWTLIETIEEPASRSGVRYSAHRRDLLEPFLPGVYSIPSGVLRIESDDIAEAIELTLEPIDILVEGVLPDSDLGELNPIAELALPDEPQQTSTQPLLIIGIGASGVLALVILLVLRRSGRVDEPVSIYEQLSHISNDPSIGDDEGFDRLGRVFDQIDPRLRQTSEFAEMIRACDRARYAPEPDAHASPARIARHTLELLGHEPARSPRGGAA